MSRDMNKIYKFVPIDIYLLKLFLSLIKRKTMSIRAYYYNHDWVFVTVHVIK